MSHSSATPLATLSAIGGATQGTEIVFIEGSVDGIDVLRQGVGPGKEVYVLDAVQDGLAQMAEILQGRSGVDAIHILSHGSTGSLRLGILELSNTNLQNRASDLALIGQALTDAGDILLYGCEVAVGEGGVQFVGKLAQLTGADVAASTDLTGAASLGGNWVLEKQTGQIEAHLPGFQLADYASTLTPLVQANLFTADGSIPGGTLSTANILKNFTTAVSSTDPTHFFWYQSPGYEVVLDRLKDGQLGSQTSSVASVFPSDVST